MPLDRRSLLAATGAAALALPARAAPLGNYGLDAAHYGVRPGAADDQTGKLQRAIDDAARRQVPLALAPGVYRASELKLRSGAQIVGVRGASRLVLTHGDSLLSSEDGAALTLSGISLDGGKRAPTDRALLHLLGAKDVRITDCLVENSGGSAITLEHCSGIVEGNSITNAGDTGLFCLDSRSLIVRGNRISGCGNGGIRVWQGKSRQDGSLIADNTIEEIDARGGGDGQNGNGINVFRAAGVIVRDNAVRRCAFSAVRGNAASDMQVLGNRCFDIGEVAIYAEFDFEGAVIANNIVDGAALGVSVTNFNRGGRLAVVQGNLIRNLKPARPQGGPDAAGLGIAVEADSTVTGNVIEHAPWMGISVGAGEYLRDVAVTGNVIRETGIGIGVSVAPRAGGAVISGNVISGARRGAILGMQWGKPQTGDFAKDGAAGYPQLTVANNRVS
jgi:uncharacterized secreted repeat protein (TIGR03808 family)